jgi:hypothetical protein
MPKPTTREELLKETYNERSRLEELIKTIPGDVFESKKVVGEWTAKDVISHLIAWEQMVILWVKSGYEGKSIPVPAEGYKWSELPALNDKIYREHKDEPASEVMEKFDRSYHQILDLLNSISEQDLFTPGLHKWQNKNMLAAYFKSSMSSHYLWARKEITKGLKK